jgi:hypothetical protein
MLFLKATPHMNVSEQDREVEATAENTGAASENAARLSALVELLKDLNRRAVRYCVWKSTPGLERALRGETDLDILVDRRHADVFSAVLHLHRLKPVQLPVNLRYPAIEHYLGFDADSGRMFHLHVHYQLVLGERFVKNYRLPLETQFLDSARLRNGIKLPSPELELMVLSLRAILKYRLRDLIKDVLEIRSPGIPEPMFAEIRFLLQQTSMERIASALADNADIVPSATVQSFLRLMSEDRRAGYRLWRLRSALRRDMKGYRRYHLLAASVLYARELLRNTKPFKRLRTGRMTLPRGGVAVALVGVDGSGKTTLSQTLAAWLQWKLDARVFYIGSKQPSRRSNFLYLVFRAFRRSQRVLSQFASERGILCSAVSTMRDAALCGHHLSVAHDRFRSYQAGRDAAVNGSFVLFDRFPLWSPASWEDSRLMDGPHIPSVVGQTRSTLLQVMGQREQSVYSEIKLPDHILMLDVSPIVSLQRKPDHNPETIEAKTRALRNIRDGSGALPPGSSLICLDTDRPLEEVISELKGKIWNIL